MNDLTQTKLIIEDAAGEHPVSRHLSSPMERDRLFLEKNSNFSIFWSLDLIAVIHTLIKVR